MTRNKHISLVKKWLNDPDSVSLYKLRDNFSAASDAVHAAEAEQAAAKAVVEGADAAFLAAHAAAFDPAQAAHWVKQYEELTNEWK